MLKIGKRLILFIVVNLLILVTLSLTLNFLGVRPYLDANGIDYASLMTFCLVWGMGGAFISLGISRMTAKWLMGVHVIDPNTRDSELSWLVNTVHRLARSAGIGKMPQVGVYDSPEINAFATGPTRNRALVAVSAGLFQNMSREQIEGVLGHEIAHVANGDMVTMTLLQGVINAVVMFLARVIASFVGGRRDDSRGTTVLVTFVLEIILSVFGAIVVAAFSRHREYRADAGGAALTGRDKMIAALEALLKTLNYADLTHRQSITAFKISGAPRFLSLFSTHPPLEKRIERLKTGF